MFFMYSIECAKRDEKLGGYEAVPARGLQSPASLGVPPAANCITRPSRWRLWFQ